MSEGGLPDPGGSRAVLVGVSAYRRMPADRQLPTVATSLERLAALLTDARIWGLPTSHCTVVPEPADADVVVAALRSAVKEAEEALLFYFAGHGLIDPATGHDLYLGLPEVYEPGGTHLGLRYEHIRRELRMPDARSRQKMVILDCCWSGTALAGGMAGSAGAASVGTTAIEGTAVLTASAATRMALAPPGEPYTAFTGELVGILDQGLLPGPRVLDAATLYRALYDRLAAKGRPLPQFGAVGDVAQIGVARNTAWAPSETGPVVLSTAAQASELRNEADRRLRTGDYGAARALRVEAAFTGDPEAIRILVASYRRSGRYADADELERAAGTPDRVPAVLSRLGEFRSSAS